MRLACPRCGGFVVQEPAALICCACGHYVRIADAPLAARTRQAQRDVALRPRSIECLSPFNSADYQPPRRGELRLPGETTGKRRSRRKETR
jgi:uncharacterized Zn finger protein (UPF0148 family)